MNGFNKIKDKLLKHANLITGNIYCFNKTTCITVTDDNILVQEMDFEKIKKAKLEYNGEVYYGQPIQFSIERIKKNNDYKLRADPFLDYYLQIKKLIEFYDLKVELDKKEITIKRKVNKI